MDSGNCSDNTKLQAIVSALDNGRLTPLEVCRRLKLILEKEYDKPTSDRNEELVLVCEKLLYEIYTKSPYVSRKEESKKALKERLKAVPRRFSLFVHRSLIAVCVLFVIAVGVEVLFGHEWLTGTSSPDEEQYQIEGHKAEVNTLPDGHADSEDTYGQLRTSNLDEVQAFLGYTPELPTWLPEGWALKDYHVIRAPAITKFSIRYVNKAANDYLLTYSFVVYGDINQATIAFEQERSGVAMSVDGISVYISDNTIERNSIWIDGKTCFCISGLLTDDETVAIIKSIRKDRCSE